MRPRNRNKQPSHLLGSVQISNNRFSVFSKKRYFVRAQCYRTQNGFEQQRKNQRYFVPSFKFFIFSRHHDPAGIVLSACRAVRGRHDGRRQRAAPVRGVPPSGRGDPAERQFGGPVASRPGGQFPAGRQRRSTETHRAAGPVPAVPDRGDGRGVHQDGGLRAGHVQDQRVAAGHAAAVGRQDEPDNERGGPRPGLGPEQEPTVLLRGNRQRRRGRSHKRGQVRRRRQRRVQRLHQSRWTLSGQSDQSRTLVDSKSSQFYVSYKFVHSVEQRQILFSTDVMLFFLIL